METPYTFDVDGSEGNALFDMLLGTEYDHRLSNVYHELGLRPNNNARMEVIN